MTTRKNQVNSLITTFRNDLDKVLSQTDIFRPSSGNAALPAESKRLLGYIDQSKTVSSSQFNIAKSMLISRGASEDSAAALALLLNTVAIQSGTRIQDLISSVDTASVTLANSAYARLNSIRKPESQFLRYAKPQGLQRYVSTSPAEPVIPPLEIEMSFDEIAIFNCCEETAPTEFISRTITYSATGGVEPYIANWFYMDTNAEFIELNPDEPVEINNDISTSILLLSSDSASLELTQNANCELVDDSSAEPPVTIRLVVDDSAGSTVSEISELFVAFELCPPTGCGTGIFDRQTDAQDGRVTEDGICRIIESALTITPEVAPPIDIQVDLFVNLFFFITGGNNLEPIDVSLSSGELPPGMILNTANSGTLAIIVGSSSVIGEYPFTITAQSGDLTAELEYLIRIVAPPPAPAEFELWELGGFGPVSPVSEELQSGEYTFTYDDGTVMTVNGNTVSVVYGDQAGLSRFYVPVFRPVFNPAGTMTFIPLVIDNPEPSTDPAYYIADTSLSLFQDFGMAPPTIGLSQNNVYGFISPSAVGAGLGLFVPGAVISYSAQYP